MTLYDLSRDEILDLSRDTTLYEWTAQRTMQPLVVDRAKGIYFWDVDGKRYMDFNSQLMCVNIGHGDTRVLDAIKAQLDQLCYVSAMSRPPWRRLRRGPRPAVSCRK